MYNGIVRIPNSQKQATKAGNYDANDQTNLGKFRFSKRFSTFNLSLQVHQLTEIILIIWLQAKLFQIFKFKQIS